MPENVARLGLEVEFKNVDEATRSLDRLEGQSRDTEKQTTKLDKANRALSVGLKAAGIAAVAAAAGIAAIVRGSGQAINELASVSNRLGFSVEQLQSLNFVFEQTNVSTDTAALALQRLQRRVAEAAQGTGEAVNALKELNLSAEELAGLTVDEQFRRIATAFEGVTSASDQTRLAFKLFDSEGVDLIKTLSQGSDEIARLEERARELGLVLTEQQVASVQAAASETDEWIRVLKSLGETLAVEVIRAIVSFSGEIDANMVRAIRSGIVETVNFASTLVDVLVVSFDKVITLGKAWITVVQGVGQATAAFVQAVKTGSFEPLKQFADEFATTFDQVLIDGITSIEAQQDKRLASLRAFAEKTDAIVNANRARRGNAGNLSTFGADAAAETARQRAAEVEARRRTTEASRAQAAQERAIEQERKRLFAETTREIEAQDQAMLELGLARMQFTEDAERQLDNTRRLAAAIEVSVDAFEAQERVIAAENAIIQANLGLSTEQEQAIQRRLILIQEETDALQERAAEIRRQEDAVKTFTEGFHDSFDPFITGLQDTGGAIADVFKSAFGQAEDALTRFLTTGEFNFKEFANAIIADLIRVSIQQSVIQFGASLFGGFFQQGGVFAGGREIAFQGGGVLRGPSKFGLAGGATGIAGEAGAEAIVPLARTPSGELGIRSSGGGGGNVINVTVENPNNAADAEQNGEVIGRAVQRIIRQTTVSEIQQQRRSGNLLNRQRVI